MKNVLSDAKKQFQNISKLLNSQEKRNNDYFTELSIATEEAYFTMNSGMCSNSTVCHECADHRDFVRSMMDVLGELEVNASAANSYSDKLSQYAERVSKILKNIETVLAS
ncbi:MAG: hypothetical protein PHQ90_08980 [Sulfuricurvum sp.]|uniref:hypothetical protein n=1 Tax=Sulfuricurvum sp. TaxID=2025608 RepID=UPI00260273D4|nr:hypothetical protein [Sulfuricurvum sp.]MDD2369423.1 hypothetical protein [Sulfuricurvum sp.]MDD2950919.1 hypothetical protein [Sulfuricurvum sp.]MDD5118200.1 hypothetical protein [Sulfuricurvum sp.]